MTTFILGPCLMESKELYLSTAQTLAPLMSGRDWLYKSSFDKANRTAIGSKRGPGMKEALEWMKELKTLIPGIRLTTDVHETTQCETLAQVIDCIQIPAFLCRQTDLLVEAGKHFNLVNVKKGQWISPTQALHFLDKVRSENPQAEVWITERGTFFGYDRLTVDFSTVDLFRKHYSKVVLDCTHSTQQAQGSFTGGDRELAKRFMLTATTYRYNGIFAEVHPNPAHALSDADSQIQLSQVKELLKAFDAVQKITAPLIQHEA